MAVLVAANAVVVVGLWWRQGGIREIHDLAGLLTSLGRVTGLLGAYLALVELLLLARIPVLDAVGLERMGRWHRINGTACLALLLAHTVLITGGYALDDGVSRDPRDGRPAHALLGRAASPPSGSACSWSSSSARSWPSAAGSPTACGTRCTSRPTSRSRWASAISSPPAGSSRASPSPARTGGRCTPSRSGALVGLRLVLPVARSLRHRLRIERVVREAPGVVSVEIGGVGLERLPVRAGQSLHWRFLARGHWWETHPFSLSAAPDGRRLRITVKDVGDYTRRLASLAPGTRVIVEGPSGGLTSAARRHARVALIAGGVGIAPIRALLEDTPGEPGTIAVIYRAASEDDVLFRDELDELARRRGAELHYVLGERRGDELLSAEHLQALVPDIAGRDVYVCGPPSMTEATRTSLRRAGVPRRHIVSEGFGW